MGPCEPQDEVGRVPHICLDNDFPVEFENL